jgi:hypothetical protein
MDIERFAEWFSSPYVTQGEASLRLVLAPSRSEELIDPVTLGSEEFKTQISELAHSRDVRLLKYEHPKISRVAVESLIIEQARERGRGPRDEVRLEVFSIGVIIIDSNVTDL